MIDWNDLRHFLAIAREGSVGRAARSLKVDQSTTQRRLLALEKALGCVLVERQATGYRLSPQGQILIGSVTKVEAAVDAVQRQVASFDNQDLGPSGSPASSPSGSASSKSGLIDAFHARHPGISVELLMEQRILDLSKGEADIAIRGGKPGSGALVCKKIADVPWGIYASRAFVDRYGRPAGGATSSGSASSIWSTSWRRARRSLDEGRMRPGQGLPRAAPMFRAPTWR